VRTFALLAVGADQPGIIAAVSERLYAHRVNVTDSQMGILRGHFAMTLIVEGADRDALAADLEQLPVLETWSVTEVAEAAANPRSEPNAVVSVHGADHPGIVAAVTRVLADADVNVCDLQTRLARDLYVMIMDVAVPSGLEDLEERLQAVAAEQDVAITLRAVDPDVL